MTLSLSLYDDEPHAGLMCVSEALVCCVCRVSIPEGSHGHGVSRHPVALWCPSQKFASAPPSSEIQSEGPSHSAATRNHPQSRVVTRGHAQSPTITCS